mmetsp:Transcript_1479/g.2028  ORF Transcript_1479/g.2028 Transcript_1479/m.2028 type:complete len:157 (-) Transcript_1479:1066-1536(-)
MSIVANKRKYSVRYICLHSNTSDDKLGFCSQNLSTHRGMHMYLVLCNFLHWHKFDYKLVSHIVDQTIPIDKNMYRERNTNRHSNTVIYTAVDHSLNPDNQVYRHMYLVPHILCYCHTKKNKKEWYNPLHSNQFDNDKCRTQHISLHFRIFEYKQQK